MSFLKQTKNLTPNELVKIFKERVAVFVVEQKCFYQEVDDDDDDFNDYHLVIENENNQIMAYSRIINKGDFVTFGRVLVPLNFRGNGLGKQIVAETIAAIHKLYPNKPIKIEAQAYLAKFYTKFGLKQTSEIYNIDNIPHMIWK